MECKEIFFNFFNFKKLKEGFYVCGSNKRKGNKGLCIENLKAFAETLFPKTDIAQYDESLFADVCNLQTKTLMKKKDEGSFTVYKMLTDVCIYYTTTKKFSDSP